MRQKGIDLNHDFYFVVGKQCRTENAYTLIKGNPMSYKTTFMPKSFLHIPLWTHFYENLYEG
jgi:hypothetical protein